MRRYVLISFVILILAILTACDYVLSPSQQSPKTTCPCKDPIYTVIYQQVDEIIFKLSTTITETDKNIIRQQLIASRLKNAGSDDSPSGKAQMKARWDAIVLYYNMHGTCPVIVGSDIIGTGYHVTLVGPNNDKWDYDTIYPSILSGAK